MVIVAPEELRGDIESALSNEAREAIVGWATAEAHANATELLEVVAAASRRALGRARRSRRSSAGARRRAGTAAPPPGGSRRSRRPPTVASSCCSSRSGANQTAVPVPAVRARLATDGSCPLDGNRLEQRDDGGDLAVHHVARARRLGAVARPRARSATRAASAPSCASSDRSRPLRRRKRPLGVDARLRVELAVAATTWPCAAHACAAPRGTSPERKCAAATRQ